MLAEWLVLMCVAGVFRLRILQKSKDGLYCLAHPLESELGVQNHFAGRLSG